MLLHASTRPAGTRRGQVDPAAQPPGVGHHLAEDPQPGHAPVGVDGQPDVGDEPVRRADRHQVGPVAPEIGLTGQRGPGGGAHLGRRGVAEQRGPVDRGGRRVVAPEVRGVDRDAADDGGRGEPDDDEVRTGLPAAPGLPAVVDLAADPERRRVVRRRPWIDEVVRVRVELVAGAEHRSAQRPAGHVGQEAEVRHPGAARAGHGLPVTTRLLAPRPWRQSR